MTSLSQSRSICDLSAFVWCIIFLSLLCTAPLLYAKNNAEIRVEVMGTAFVDLVEYPDKGVSSKALVKTLLDARNRFPRRMTMDELNSVADDVTIFYRSKGYKFHSVYLPPQKSKGGLINFKVLEATLGDIQVTGENIDEDAIKAVFAPFLSLPLYQPDIDKVILALKDQNGIDAVAYYSRGSQVGEIRLNIKVNQRNWGGYAQMDN